MTDMKKFPTIQLNQLTPLSVGVCILGFCLMQAEALQDVGSIVFSLGLLPLALMLSKYKD
jgi:Na+/phosphate symporter